jgi:hypothetical protein
MKQHRLQCYYVQCCLILCAMKSILDGYCCLNDGSVHLGPSGYAKPDGIAMTAIDGGLAIAIGESIC